MSVSYWEWSPSGLLGRYVKRFWAMERPGGAGGADHDADVERVLPDGCVELIVHYGDPFLVKSDKGRWSENPRALVAGQMRRRLDLRASGAIGMVGVRFWPFAAREALGAPMSTLTDGFVAIEDVVGSWGRELGDRVLEAETPRERVALLAEALSSRFVAGANGVTLCEFAVGEILESRGGTRVEALARKLGTSRRTLERVFLDRVGLGVKELARIVRFQMAFQMLREAKPGAMVAVDCGFTDQAHLWREFREIAGASPGAYFAMETGMGASLASCQVDTPAL
jgi:AraC-like DNA-binding protein